MSLCISSRSATFLLAFVGLVLNLTAVFYLVRLWKSLRWETESEWEGSEKYAQGALRIVWCLLSAYFSVASVACVVGLLGVLNRIPAYVRLYRDYSVADLCVCALSTVAFALASFRPAVRAVICEELTRQPDLMRDLAEAGLNVENCESWFERVVVATVGLMGVLLVVRLQFTLTISNFYTHLLRSTLHIDVVSPSTASISPHRIYLLPTPANPKRASDVLVYAPIPLNSISEADARDLDATEAWVSPLHQHSSHRSHHRSGSRGISLPIYPNEGLLPERKELHN